MSKTVLITGASRGIGKTCAILFAMQGYNVAINYNNSEEHAKKLLYDIKSNGKTAAVYKADVSDINQVKSMTEAVYSDFKSIDVLVNNAGISLNGVFTDITYKQWEKLCGVNLSGTIYCSQFVLPYMVKQHSGRIINISSVWGVQGGACEAHYSATKAGIIGLTKALSKEYAPSNITVNCIAPGVVNTDMLSVYDKNSIDELAQKTPLNRLATTTDIANAVVFLVSDRADFITGQVIGVDGGFFG